MSSDSPASTAANPVSSSAPGAGSGILTGCFAVVTGASSGLGREFARQLAPKAGRLLLAARSTEALENLRRELSAAHEGLQVEFVACDLAAEEGRAALWRSVDATGAPATVLINSAGLGDYGPFRDATAERLRTQIDLNVTALTLLAREFVARVQPAGGPPAAILNVSSLAASLPVPDLAVYAASKSYVTSLSEALDLELAPAVRVTAVCPGPTPTNFSKTARREDGRDTDRTGQDWLRLPPTEVVASSLAALERGTPRHFPGWRVRLAAAVFESFPRFLMRKILLLRRRRSMLR